MTSDLSAIPEAIKGTGEIAKVAGKVYEDLAAPLARQLGQTGGALAEAILTGPRELFLTVTQVQEWLGGYVRKRLEAKGVSPERIRPPDPQVYLGAVSGMMYSGHVEELRAMFGNLLTRAVDVSSAGMVHPSFAEIVRQLSPAEARLVRHLRQEGYVPTISVKAHHQILSGEHDVADHLTLIADELEIPLFSLGIAFQNLERLGLLKRWTDRHIIPSGEYHDIENDERIVKLLEVDLTWRRAYAVRGFVEMTPFGTLFGTVCLDYEGACPVPAISDSRENS